MSKTRAAEQEVCRLIIGVAGGSGSGKSLFARALADRLKPRGVLLLSEDDYYRQFQGPDFDPSRFDFDVPSARDHELLAEHLDRLGQGLAIARPVYSFPKHAPLKRRIPTPPAEVVIIEGLHVLHDPGVRSRLHFGVFLDVDGDIRFIRRLLRDTRERGRSVKFVTRQYLATVKPAHDLYVQPTRALADLVLRFDPTQMNEAEVLPRWLDATMAALPSLG